MSSNLQCITLARLLALNNWVHDLQNLLLQTRLRVVEEDGLARLDVAWPGRIAQLQQEIDRGVRASLMTCWLGDEAAR